MVGTGATFPHTTPDPIFGPFSPNTSHLHGAHARARTQPARILHQCITQPGPAPKPARRGETLPTRVSEEQQQSPAPPQLRSWTRCDVLPPPGKPGHGVVTFR